MDYEWVFNAITSSSLVQNTILSNCDNNQIIHDIVLYSIDKVAVCCNHSSRREYCQNTIKINNLNDFHAMKDDLQRCIYYYPAMSNIYETHYIPYSSYSDGIRVRIFCSHCTPKLSRCPLKSITFPGKQCESYDTNDICAKHQCFICHQTLSGTYRIRFTCSIKSCAKIACYCIANYNENDEIKETLCDSCSTQHEINTIAGILNGIYGDKFAQINNVIAQYSYGYIIKCCNDRDHCSNEVIINNVWDRNKLQKDFAYHNHINRGNSDYGHRVIKFSEDAVNVYGEKWRIFCENCTDDSLTKCDVCLQLESNTNYYDNKWLDWWSNAYRGINVCQQHPYCIICNEQSMKYNMSTCYKCQGDFCHDCGIKEEWICGNCCVLQEYELIYTPIYEILYKKDIITELNIIDLITNYSTGYVLACCNFDKCETEIFVESQFEFNKHKNKRPISMGMSSRTYIKGDYSLYSIDKTNYFYDMNDTHWYIYNEEIRIFCKFCVNTYCLQCKYSNCGNMEIRHDFYRKTICKNHPFCDYCGKYEWQQYGFMDNCSFCGADCCKKCHVLHSKYHEREDCFVELKKYGLTKYDNDQVFKKICKPYSLI